MRGIGLGSGVVARGLQGDAPQTAIAIGCDCGTGRTGKSPAVNVGSAKETLGLGLRWAGAVCSVVFLVGCGGFVAIG